MRSKLSICTFVRSESLGNDLDRCLGGDRYCYYRLSSAVEFVRHLDEHRQNIDCLMVQQIPELPDLLARLREHKMFLPMVVVKESVFSQRRLPTYPETLEETQGLNLPNLTETRRLYHDAVLEVTADQLPELPSTLEQAIATFLKLSTMEQSNGSQLDNIVEAIATQHSLKRQQRRLAEKLKERLGYLGVYYKRDPKNFFRRLSHEKQQELLNRLKQDYQDIILNYFSDDEGTNSKIDDFVNIAFFADISVSQIVEIHMELMEEFSKQLQLEGRSEEILLDYRLTLIDTIAHLCEMYRRSIPRES